MKKKKRGKFLIKGHLFVLGIMPLAFFILIVIYSLHINLYSKKAFLVGLIYIVIAGLINLYIYFINNRMLDSELVKYAQSFGEIQGNIINDMTLPFAIISEDGHMLWSNKEFLNIISSKKAAKRNISNVFADITPRSFPGLNKDVTFQETLGDKVYKVVLKRIPMRSVENDDESDSEEDARLPFDKIAAIDSCVLMTVYDYTDFYVLERKVKDENLIVGLMYIDNYEETFTANDDVTQTLSVAITERRINSFMSNIDAISRKFEKDKYLFVFKEKYLEGIKEGNFSIIEEVQETINTSQTACTLSVGIGTGGENFAMRYNQARAAIDLALGRGGNQAVIKNDDSEEFFGGKQVKVERTTRVKARIKAHALKEIIESKERVVVMGHQMGDTDSFGACVGIYKIAKILRRKVYIVLGECSKSVYPIRDSFAGNKYDNDMIIDNEQAINLVDEDTALVVVDVNKADRTQCPELLNQTDSIVVIDHHRQEGNSIDNAILFYIEPYSSSACEMIAEISQYIDNGDKLTIEEANALYAGIMIDTNYFTNKCGVRTFETMAFLKRNGADTVKLRKMFREDLDDYRLKASAIQTTEIYLDGYAIAVSDHKEASDPTVLGAKVANALLEINGVKASFVLTPYNNQIYVSARSIDEVNVGVLMEKLGGGGHLNMAGAQFKGDDIDGAIEKIKDVINKAEEKAKKAESKRNK